MKRFFFFSSTLGTLSIATCAAESNAYDACIENNAQCGDADAICFAA